MLALEATVVNLLGRDHLQASAGVNTAYSCISTFSSRTYSTYELLRSEGSIPTSIADFFPLGSFQMLSPVCVLYQKGCDSFMDSRFHSIPLSLKESTIRTWAAVNVPMENNSAAPSKAQRQEGHIITHRNAKLMFRVEMSARSLRLHRSSSGKWSTPESVLVLVRQTDRLFPCSII